MFTAGPTVRWHQPHLTSWRGACIEEFGRQGFEGSLIVPEFRDRAEADKGKLWIPLWEYNGLRRANAILFWVPRTPELIGLTTNHEHGYWLGRERHKMVCGWPPDAYRLAYLDLMWEADAEERGLPEEPIHSDLAATVAAAIAKATERPFERSPYRRVVSQVERPVFGALGADMECTSTT